MVRMTEKTYACLECKVKKSLEDMAFIDCDRQGLCKKCSKC